MPKPMASGKPQRLISWWMDGTRREQLLGKTSLETHVSSCWANVFDIYNNIAKFHSLQIMKLKITLSMAVTDGLSTRILGTGMEVKFLRNGTLGYAESTTMFLLPPRLGKQGLCTTGEWSTKKMSGQRWDSKQTTFLQVIGTGGRRSTSKTR